MKIAILIAHASREPFVSARFLTESRVVAGNASLGVDTFYVSGDCSNSFNMFIRDQMEKIRWTRFFFLLRFLDTIAMHKFHKKFAPLSLSGRDIQVEIPEDIRHLTPKLLAAYNLLYKMDYDWIVRTTIFSVIRTKMLVGILEQLSLNKPIVGGKIVEQFDKSKFVSGSFTVLNKVAINEIIQSKSKIKFGLIDDIAFDKLFTELGFEILSFPTLTITSKENIGSVGYDEIAKACHIRCRSTMKSKNDLSILNEILNELSLD